VCVCVFVRVCVCACLCVRACVHVRVISIHVRHQCIHAPQRMQFRIDKNTPRTADMFYVKTAPEEDAEIGKAIFESFMGGHGIYSQMQHPHRHRGIYTYMHIFNYIYIHMAVKYLCFHTIIFP
jgi:hypothetical protein